METIQQKSVFRPSRGMAFIAVFFVTAMLIFAWSMPASGAPPQRLFSSPENALKTLAEAVKINNNTLLSLNYLIRKCFRGFKV